MSDSVCSNQEARSSSLSCSCEPQGLAAFSFSRLCLRTLLPEASVFPRREWGNEGLLVGWGVSCLVMEEVPSPQLAPPPSAPSSLGCRSSTVCGSVGSQCGIYFALDDAGSYNFKPQEENDLVLLPERRPWWEYGRAEKDRGGLGIGSPVTCRLWCWLLGLTQGNGKEGHS